MDLHSLPEMYLLVAEVRVSFGVSLNYGRAKLISNEQLVGSTNASHTT
jgi:hypothetical protein